MKSNFVSVKEAAEHLGTTHYAIKLGLQRKQLPIGVAIKLSGRWAYFINRNKLEEFSGKGGRELYDKLSTSDFKTSR